MKSLIHSGRNVRRHDLPGRGTRTAKQRSDGNHIAGMAQKWRIAIATRILIWLNESVGNRCRPTDGIMMRRQRLAQRRKAVGLSQERLAERVGVDRSTVVRWERGDTGPQPWHRPRLAQALAVSVDDLAELLNDARDDAARLLQAGRHISGAEAELLATTTPSGQRLIVPDSLVQEGHPYVARSVEPSSASDTADVEASADRVAGRLFDRGDDVLRRDVLRYSAAGAVATDQLVMTLLAPGRDGGNLELPTRSELSQSVRRAKGTYQACHYEQALGHLVTLLPQVDAACSSASLDERDGLRALAAEAYHVAGSVFLKLGDNPMALVAAERCAQSAAASGDPIAVAASARLTTHALMSNGRSATAVDFAQGAGEALEGATGLASAESVAVYGALLLRAAIAAARTEDRDTAITLLDEAERAAQMLGHDGNERWTGFGPTNVLQHRMAVALSLGDAGTAIQYARQLPLQAIRLPERKARLFVDVAQAYAQWGRRDKALAALRTAYQIAPEEIRARSTVHRLVGDLAALSYGSSRTEVADFARSTGVPL